MQVPDPAFLGTKEGKVKRCQSFYLHSQVHQVAGIPQTAIFPAVASPFPKPQTRALWHLKRAPEGFRDKPPGSHQGQWSPVSQPPDAQGS